MIQETHLNIVLEVLPHVRGEILILQMPLVVLVYELALLGAGHILRGRLLRDDLPRLRPLERAEHDEDGLPVLLRPHGAGGVGASLAHPVYVVQDGRRRSTQEEVALAGAVSGELEACKVVYSRVETTHTRRHYMSNGGRDRKLRRHTCSAYS